MIAEAINIVRQTPRDQFSKGCAAKFVPIDEKWGIKFYRYESIRDRTYDAQAKAFSEGIAPELGTKLEFELDGYPKFGYITERIETVEDRFCKKHNLPIGTKVDDLEDLEDLARQERWDMEESWEYKDLMNSLESIDMDTLDMHWRNVGWLPDGRFVVRSV
jgi:hypothetical protein